MSNAASEAAVYLAFRFHVNFYHSYRGDAPDETGIGRDIRIIRGLIRDLDALNAAGIPVRGSWDIENYYSLERMMPRHCPDIIDALRRRIGEGLDEAEPMSYNNGLLSAHTPQEFAAAVERSMHNDARSGLRDLFGTCTPLIRPQEMVYTPAMIGALREAGIEALSLYYSAVPFNAFSNFIPPLSTAERHNPLMLVHPEGSPRMPLLPAVNHGDLADRLSLRRWLKELRRHQLRGAKGRAKGEAGQVESGAAAEQRRLPDLLLLLDMDADDAFWEGYRIPLVSRLFRMAQGFRRLVESVADLSWLRFTTPGEYLAGHEPLREITIRQDTADGSFDGYSSWTEKWSNHEVWTRLDRARLTAAFTRSLLAAPAFLGRGRTAENVRPQAERLLGDAFEARLRLLSTTHFGLSAPIMNRVRLDEALRLARRAEEAARSAFDLAAGEPAGEAGGVQPADGQPNDGQPDAGSGSAGRQIMWRDLRGGAGEMRRRWADIPARLLLRAPLTLPDTKMPPAEADCRGDGLQSAALRDSSSGRYLPAAVLRNRSGAQLMWISTIAPGEEQRAETELSSLRSSSSSPIGDERRAEGGKVHTIAKAGTYAVRAEPELLSAGNLDLRFRNGIPVELSLGGETLMTGPFLRSGVTYGRGRGKIFEIPRWKPVETAVCGEDFALLRFLGRVRMGKGNELQVEREFLASPRLPYLWLSVHVRYPRTKPYKSDPQKVRNLGADYDRRWQEVWPAEIRPDWKAPFTIWKHNYWGEITSYSPHYASFSANRSLPSFNNHLTAGWVAVSGEGKGLVVGQTARTRTAAAFCPMRTVRRFGREALRLNPFGTYRGPQLRSPIARTGIGRLAAQRTAEQLHSLAPSYNGQEEHFELFLAPYRGDRPPEQYAADAWGNAFPPLIMPLSPAGFGSGSGSFENLSDPIPEPLYPPSKAAEYDASGEEP